MESIMVDFEVWREVTSRRQSKQMTENDVLRSLLGLEKVSPVDEGPGWTWKGVNLPNKSRLKAEYKGREYAAEIVGNEWVQDGKTVSSPSLAANYVTGGSVNGWDFWSVLLPDRTEWLQLSVIRDMAPTRGMDAEDRWKAVMRELNRMADEELMKFTGAATVQAAVQAAVKAGEGKIRGLNHAFWSIKNWRDFEDVLKQRLAGNQSKEAAQILQVLARMEIDKKFTAMTDAERKRRWDALLSDEMCL